MSIYTCLGDACLKLREREKHRDRGRERDKVLTLRKKINLVQIK